MTKPTGFITMISLANKLAKELGITQPKAQAFMWGLFEGMAVALQFQDRLTVKNFGGFSVRHCKGPLSSGAVKDGTPVGERLPDYKKVHFKASFKIE